MIHPIGQECIYAYVCIYMIYKHIFFTENITLQMVVKYDKQNTKLRTGASNMVVPVMW